MKLQEIFINNLKSYRKQKKLTQSQLSLLLDKSFNYINGIECGASFPSPDVIDKLAEIFSIKSYQLFLEDACPENIVQSGKNEFIEDLSENLSKKIKREIKTVIKTELSEVLK